jgi:hypothetical protein
MVISDKYDVKIITLEDYSSQLEESYEYNGFFDPYFLKHFFPKIKFYSINYSNNILAIFPFVKDKNLTDNLFLIKYYGPAWSKYYRNQKKHKQIHHHQMAVYTMVDFYLEMSKSMHYFLFYTDLDVRPLMNYFESPDIKYSLIIKPRYTAVINGLSNINESELLLNYRQAKRYEISKFRKDLLMESGIIDFYNFRDIYLETIELNSNSSQIEVKLIHLYEGINKFENFRILSFYLNDDIVGYVLLLVDKVQCHCMIKAQKRSYIHYSPVLFHEAIMYTKNLGRDVFDFNGANSLIGSSEKHSFGAEEKLFFEIRLEE